MEETIVTTTDSTVRESECVLRVLQALITLAETRQAAPLMAPGRPWAQIEVVLHADALKNVDATAEYGGVVYTARDLADRLVAGGRSANIWVRVHPPSERDEANAHWE